MSAESYVRFFALFIQLVWCSFTFGYVMDFIVNNWNTKIL